jgi:F-type H+-transporting ATPase subunit delta
MAELVTVARPYAEAAFRAALDDKDLAGWSAMLQLAATIARDVNMSALLANPKVDLARKRDCFHAVAAGNLNQTAGKLVDMLIECHRAILLGSISKQFETMKHAHENVLKANIVSAFAMDEATRQDLIRSLTKKYGKSVEAEVVVDTSLIGGVRIEIGDEVIHASVRDTLDKMAVSIVQ